MLVKNATWPSSTELFLKIEGQWRPVAEGYSKIDGQWVPWDDNTTLATQPLNPTNYEHTS